MLLLPRSLQEQPSLWLGPSDGCSNFVAVSWQSLQDEERKTEQGKELISPWRSPVFASYSKDISLGNSACLRFSQGTEPDAGQ